MYAPQYQTSATHLSVLRVFIHPFLKLSALLITSVLVLYDSRRDLDLGMKLVSAALRIIVVVKARVAIVVQLTDLWKSKNTVE